MWAWERHEVTINGTQEKESSLLDHEHEHNPPASGVLLSTVLFHQKKRSQIHIAKLMLVNQDYRQINGLQNVASSMIENPSLICYFQFKVVVL